MTRLIIFFLLLLSTQGTAIAQATVVWLQPNPDEFIGNAFIATAPTMTLKVRVVGVNNPSAANFVVELDGNILTAGRYGNASLTGSTWATNVELRQGQQTLRVGYLSNGTTDWSPPLVVNYGAGKANLHVLAIGTSPPNLRYTEADAKGIAKAFETQGGSGGLYGKVSVNTLLGDEATAARMKIELARLNSAYRLGHLKDNDLLVVYIATHGDVRDGQLYLQGDDYDPLAAFPTSLSYQEIVSTFNELPCKKLLLLDACKSGNARGSAVNNAIRELSRSVTGTTIFTSSDTDQLSYEDPSWGHGAFTLALLDGLKGRADFNNDSVITVKELSSYTSKEVPKMVLSTLGHEQLPNLTRNDLGDLPFFKLSGLPLPPPPQPKVEIIDVDELDCTDAESCASKGYSAWMNDNNHLESIKLYSKAIYFDPKHEYYYYRAIGYFLIDAYNKAIADLDTAIALNPLEINYYRERGDCYKYLKDYDNAFKDYKKGISLNPTIDNEDSSFDRDKIEELYINIVKLFIETKNYQSALQYVDKSRSVLGDYFDYSDLLEYRYHILVLSKNYQQAIQEINKFIYLDSTDEYLFKERGFLYLKTGQTAKAIKDFDTAIEINPNFMDSYLHRAEAYVKSNDYLKAHLDYNKANALCRKDGFESYFYISRSKFYMKQEKWESAITDAKEGIELSDDNGEGYGVLALIYAAKGDLELFYQNLEIAISPEFKYPYDLEEALMEEGILQKIKTEARFQELLRKSKH